MEAEKDNFRAGDPQWEFAVKVPQWRLRSEGSAVKVPQWRLRSEGSAVKISAVKISALKIDI